LIVYFRAQLATIKTLTVFSFHAIRAILEDG
jgi:hypothetical protein